MAQQEGEVLQGVPCPECQGNIPVTVDELLGAGEFTCPTCGLEICVDRERSAEALAKLRENRDVLDRISSSVPGAQW